MGSIEERKHISGNTSYRLRLRKRGVPTFCITFDNLEEAAHWMVKNEKEYYKDPDKYLKWREKVYFEMHKDAKRTSKHIKRPHLRNVYEK